MSSTGNKPAAPATTVQQEKDSPILSKNGYGDPARPASTAGRPFETQPTKSGVYVYRISSMGYGSAKLGACEVCQKPVSEMHLQTEGITYDDLDDHNVQVTYAGCRSLRGHHECLIGARR